MKRIIVAGGRDLLDKALVYGGLDKLRQLHGDLFVIQGGASGVDLLARNWAEDRDMPSATVFALWAKYGRIAGPKRNAWMLELEPHLGIVFPGGNGTLDTRRRLLAAGVTTYEVNEDGMTLLGALFKKQKELMQ